MYEILKTDEFDKWLRKLRDKRAVAKILLIPFKFLNAALDMEDKCFENESLNADIAELWRGLETKLSRPLFHLYAAI